MSTLNNPDLTKKLGGKVIHCLHCNNNTYVHLVSQYMATDQIKDSQVVFWHQWNLYRCPTCKEVTLERVSECSEHISYSFDNQRYIEPETSILYPSNPINTLPEPHKDLPVELILDYEEARSIAHLSPRGSAAILRLILQKLCIHLGCKGKNIDNDIADLVTKGLPQQVQKALDIIRVIGNEAVHPGTLNINDDKAIVGNLLTIINIIVAELITKPKLIDTLYSNLPQSKLDAISKRDKACSM